MKKPKFIVEFDDIPTPRAKMRELDLEERHLNFDEVELGLTREDALREASRCLSCRRCIGCGLCLAECDRDAIVYDSEPETTRLRVDAVVLATGLEPFDAARTGKLGYQTGMNIVTSVELERILSPTGPYGGLPLRPGDGTFPKRIAFVQCVGSREEGIGADFCASTCCNEAMSLALQLSDRLDRASVTIFHRELRPFGKTGEKLEVLVEGSTRIETIPAEIESIAGDDCTGPVTVTYDRGDGSTQSEFDLVVLSIGRRASRSSRSVARKVRADTDRFGFLQTAGLSAASSTAGGIYVAGQCGGPTGLRQALASAAAAASAVTASLGPVTRDAAAPDPDGRLDPEMPPDGEAAGAIIVALCEYGLGELGEPVESVRRSVEGADGVTAVHTSRFACARRPVVELGHLL
ncbi:FAD-dependent oxidoreductase, partial [bacterium]|nr:FAD-dependent oxidoreductase [bacterium]